MAIPYSQREIRRLIGMFDVYGDFLVATPFGNGNVNDTFQLTFDQGGIRLHYILQRINSNVFKEPIKVMENVARVTSHLLKKIKAAHKETRKRTIRLLNAHDGRPFAFDDAGNCWRAYIFVEHARAYEVLETPEQAFRVAQGFGEFQQQLVGQVQDPHHFRIVLVRLSHGCRVRPQGAVSHKLHRSETEAADVVVLLVAPA